MHSGRSIDKINYFGARLYAANYRDYLVRKNVICVGGSWIVARDLVEAQNWDAITDLAAKTIAAAVALDLFMGRIAAYAPELIDEVDTVQYLCVVGKKLRLDKPS